MKSFTVRLLVVVFAAYLAPVETFPLWALIAGAAIGVFLLGPAMVGLGRLGGEMEGQKALMRFAETLDTLLENENVPLARKLIAKVREPIQ